MEMISASETLSALAHEGRLALFRALVKAGPEGLAAGRLGEAVGMAPSTLSNNLAILTRSGLATSVRDGRSIIYAADYRRMSELLAFLMEDCCDGSPEICAPLGDVLLRMSCCPPDARPGAA
ncbi:metalloregulator ArsR/SmtB family transcription factor [Brevundimonas sp. A19_0]|uniref:ArsR/SmtB family transcription factor n=1 Tax=Brevundimonas sp. A19_0 TaxID=2821087 RepID=UPI001ADC3069|nr:metalloregulator ArsR/SmtB family transcription factor [Brevundimonas sp. A19_0]MBO9502031.1 helix-turn-helix transcriptional regulator [Brevundimonas sp. A19_0]